MKLTKLITIWTVLVAFLFSSSVQAETYYFHTDHLGTPQVLTDETQAVVWQGDYDPFGQATETVPTVEQNLRFPGQYLDRESGLHNNYFRTYDPQIGRYTQSDPIGLDGGINTYGYAYQNPLSYTDPTGQFIPAAVWWAASALWAAFEVAGSAYDLYETIATFADECSSISEKAVAGGLFAAGIFLPGAGYSKVDDAATIASSSRSARREAMRNSGIPTSQQPVSQSRNASGYEYSYDVPASGGGTQRMSVQQQTMDRIHQGQPHWEAGRVKTDPLTGAVRESNYGRPALTNDKSKINY
jgi:RHS repeat-associated protein